MSHFISLEIKKAQTGICPVALSFFANLACTSSMLKIYHHCSILSIGKIIYL